MGLFDKILGTKKKDPETMRREADLKAKGQEAYWQGKEKGTLARMKAQGYAEGKRQRGGGGFSGALSDFGTALGNLERSPIGQSLSLGGFDDPFSQPRGNRGQSRRSRSKRHKRGHRKAKRSSGSEWLL